MPRLRWSEEVSAALRAHAARAWPEECCGALLSDAPGLLSARPLENVAEDRRRGFLLSARDSLALEKEAEERGLAVIGYYHSHPDGPTHPSASDAATAWSGLWTVIVPVVAGVAGDPRAFRWDEATRTFHEATLG